MASKVCILARRCLQKSKKTSSDNLVFSKNDKQSNQKAMFLQIYLQGGLSGWPLESLSVSMWHSVVLGPVLGSFWGALGCQVGVSVYLKTLYFLHSYPIWGPCILISLYKYTSSRCFLFYNNVFA